MSYLYGDSTPSPLRSNFLEFLRDAIDFGVFVLLADGRIRQGKRDIVKFERAANEEIARLEALGEITINAIGQAPFGIPGSATSNCAQELRRLTDGAVMQACATVRGQLAQSIGEVNAREAAQREECLKALEKLLLPHDPWDAITDRRIVLRGELPGEMRYAGRATGVAGCGWGWTIDLSVPEGHPLAQPMRIERLVPELEVCVPDMSGWLKKEVKVKPQRLERLYVTELYVDADVVRAKLRVEPNNDVGFNLDVSTTEPRVKMARTGAKDQAIAGSFEVRAEDVAALVLLSDKLRACANELPRAGLAEATYDEAPFKEHPNLREIVERLVGDMTPIVRNISDHSLTPTELVIKRLLADDRREEIFVSKAALREKLAPLAGEVRTVFDSLALMPALPQSTAAPMPIAVSVPPEMVTQPPASSQVVMRAESPAVTVNPELVASIKHIVQLAKRGQSEEAYNAYRELFTSASFEGQPPEHQRQALRLLVLAKAPATMTASMRDAHRAASDRLRALIEKLEHPADYEMLGICQIVLEDATSASAMFAAALEIERKRDPGSELCGNLMRRVASL